MHFFFSSGAIVALVALTVIPGRRSVVRAQNLAALPACAQPAILAAIQGSSCSLADKKCFCGNPALIPSLTSSVQEACSEADQAALSAFASTYCGTEIDPALTAASASPAAGAGSSITTIPATGDASASAMPTSISVSSSTVTASANMTANSTMTTTSMQNSTTTTMTTLSSIDWPTNVTSGGGAAETGVGMAAIAMAAGAMGYVFAEL